MRPPPPPNPGSPLRIALIGVLADQKGGPAVVEVAKAAGPSEIELHLIGYPEEVLPEAARARSGEPGRYAEEELPGLLARVRPHVVWFPAQWPETYSYTLSAAIEAGLPIVAADIGAFPERLDNRPLTWLVDPAAPAEIWLEVFAEIRAALEASPPPESHRPAQPDFYRRPFPARTGQRYGGASSRICGGRAGCRWCWFPNGSILAA